MREVSLMGFVNGSAEWKEEGSILGQQVMEEQVMWP